MCKSPDLLENRKEAMEKEKKILDLLKVWYKEATQSDPPPINDNTVLSFHSQVSHYYTSETKNPARVLPLVSTGLTEVVKRNNGIEIDFSAITNLTTSALVNTTGQETNQGYSTFVLQTFKGKLKGKDCLFKPIIVAVSFNFSPSEYKTRSNVVAFGYNLYLLCTAIPSCPDGPFASIGGDSLKYNVPRDMEIVGKRYMTKEQLDAYHPDSSDMCCI